MTATLVCSEGCLKKQRNAYLISLHDLVIEHKPNHFGRSRRSFLSSSRQASILSRFRRRRTTSALSRSQNTHHPPKLQEQRIISRSCWRIPSFEQLHDTLEYACNSVLRPLLPRMLAHSEEIRSRMDYLQDLADHLSRQTEGSLLVAGTSPLV